MTSPLLSEHDPAASTEGGIDPLGLYTIADALAIRLVPGVRERQARPRFLTAMAVAHAICRQFDPETTASDGITPPWQVFEWHVVLGLVLRAGGQGDLHQVPGRLKVEMALEDRVPLAARTYLKTPAIFGFHGVYRTLAEDLGVECDEHLAEAGADLLNEWSADQRLIGFYSSNAGDGAVWRERLIKAVEDGLKAGHTDRTSGWQGWEFFSRYLHPGRAGRRERLAIRNLLMNGTEGYRNVVLRFLVSPEGKEIWRSHESERAIHRRLRADSGAELRGLLDAILAYELFARYLQDAFDDCLYAMSPSGNNQRSSDLARLKGVKTASDKLPDLFEELVQRLAPFEQSVAFQERFAGVSERVPVQSWVERLLDHHNQVQGDKPPNGKRPWVVRLDTGKYHVRSGYVRISGGRHDMEYLHGYRSAPLWSFSKDLGMI